MHRVVRSSRFKTFTLTPYIRRCLADSTRAPTRSTRTLVPSSQAERPPLFPVSRTAVRPRMALSRVSSSSRSREATRQTTTTSMQELTVLPELDTVRVCSRSRRTRGPGEELTLSVLCRRTIRLCPAAGLRSGASWIRRAGPFRRSLQQQQRRLPTAAAAADSRV